MNDLNPFMMDALPFLGFYLTIMCAATVVALVARRMLRRRSEFSPAAIEKLCADFDPEHLGYLANGPRGAIDAALFELSLQKKIKVLDNNKLKARGGRDPKQTILKQAIVLSARETTNLLSTRKACGAEVKRIGDSLRQLGLVETFSGFLIPRIAASVVMAVPLTVGLIRVANGVQKGRPVGFLVALLVLTALVTFILMIKPRLTLGGKRLLRHFKRKTLKPSYRAFEKSALRQNANGGVDSTEKDDALPAEWLAVLPMSVAVFGIHNADSKFCMSGLQKLISADTSTPVGDTMWFGGTGGGGSGSNGGCGGGCGGCGGGCGGCGG